MNSIEKAPNRFEKKESSRCVAHELLSSIPEHQRQQLIADTMRMLLKDGYSGISEKVENKLQDLERTYYHRGYGGFEAGELLRAVMDFYMSDEAYAEQQSSQLIQSYEIWLKENGYKTSFLSVEDYKELENQALVLIKSNERNVMITLRDAVSRKIAPDDVLQEITNSGYETWSSSLK